MMQVVFFQSAALPGSVQENVNENCLAFFVAKIANITTCTTVWLKITSPCA